MRIYLPEKVIIHRGRYEDLSTRKSDNSPRPLGRGEYHF